MFFFKLPDIPDLRMKFIDALKQLVYVLFVIFFKNWPGQKKTPLIQKLQNIMPQTDIFKIVLLLQDLKIAVSLINVAAFDLMCNLLTNWHPSDIFIELLLIYWVSLHLKQLSPLYVDFCWTGLTRFLPHCTLITWRHAKQNQQGS